MSDQQSITPLHGYINAMNLLLQLFHGALSGRFVGPKSYQLGAVAEAAVRHMIEADLHDEGDSGFH